MVQQFQVEEVPDNVVPLAQPKPSMGDNAVLAGIMLALKALAQGAAIALSHIARHIVALFTAGSVFWLFMSIADPNEKQIAWGVIYAVFVLAVNMILARK